jgi:hypothetical protein
MHWPEYIPQARKKYSKTARKVEVNHYPGVH